MKKNANHKDAKKKPPRLTKEAHHRQTERTQDDQGNIYKRIWESNLAGIYVSQDGVFQAASPLMVSFTGYTEAELIGRKSDSIIHPEDREIVKRTAHEALAGKRLSPYEFRIVKKQGDIRWVMETVTSMLFRGRPAILGNFMDISERKAVEDRLKESETLYRTIFETTGAATIIIEEDMTIALLNTEFERMTGYRRQDWEGKRKWPEYIPEYEHARMKRTHYLRRIDPAAAPRNFEHDFIDSQGRIRRMYLTVDMIPGTKRSVNSFVDITARKETERGLKKREQELRAKSRNLEELNTALRVLLKQRENDRAEFEDKVLSNVKELVLPYVKKIITGNADGNTKAFAEIVESNLKDIISPFSHRLSSKHKNLTQREIQIANFIKEGKTSKEIADLLNISKSAIDIHRYRLRTKLGLNNQKVNLRSHLINIS